MLEYKRIKGLHRDQKADLAQRKFNTRLVRLNFESSEELLQMKSDLQQFGETKAQTTMLPSDRQI